MSFCVMSELLKMLLLSNNVVGNRLVDIVLGFVLGLEGIMFWWWFKNLVICLLIVGLDV